MLHQNSQLRWGLALALASQILSVNAAYGQTTADSCVKPPPLSKNWSNSELFRLDREQTAYIKYSQREDHKASKRAQELREKEMAERNKTLLEKANTAKESVLEAAIAAKEAVKDPAGFVASAINARIGDQPVATTSGVNGQNSFLEGSKTMVEKAYDKRGSNDVANSVGKTSTFASIRVMEHAAAEFSTALSTANSGEIAASGWSHITTPSSSSGRAAGPDPYDPRAAAQSAQAGIALERQAAITEKATEQQRQHRADERDYRLAVMTPQEKAERARQAKAYQDLVQHESSRTPRS